MSPGIFKKKKLIIMADPYSTLEDQKGYVGSKVIQQTTDDNKNGEINVEIFERIRDDQDREIDSYIRGRYDPVPIPAADVPDFIRIMSKKLTGYALYRRRLQTTLPEAISRDYKEVMGQLHKIQEGKISPFEAAKEPSIILTNKTEDSRTYNSTVWAGY